jgi:hypothetical protein
VPTDGGNYTMEHMASVIGADASGAFERLIDHHENATTAFFEVAQGCSGILMVEGAASSGPGCTDQFGLCVSGDGVGAGGLVGAPGCMSGMSCMPRDCPGWGSIMAMLRQHGHMPPADWLG